MQGRVIVLIVSLLAAAGVVARADRQEDIPLRQPFSLFPRMVGDWRGVDQPPLDDQIVKILGVDDYLTRTYYRAGGEGIGLYIGYWKSQRQGDTIHSPQNCLPGAGWSPISRRDLTITTSRPSGSGAATVNRYVIQKGLERQLVLYWYQSHGRIVASEYWGKMFLVADAVRLNRTDGAVVRVVTPILGEMTEAESSAEKRGVTFAGELLKFLDQFLPV